VTASAAAPGPHLLSGIRILDLGTMASSVAATLFGDFGAEVVKVERPGQGDPAREVGPCVGGRALYWAVEGRNKKSVTLDLERPQGRELFLRLVEEADAVVENFRPGTLEALGLGYETLRSRNTGIVLLRISGFGQTGPLREREAHDHVALAFGGLMHITGFADRPAIPTGTTTADYQAAVLGAFALAMALYRRDVQGAGGDEIDLAQYESVMRFTEVLIPSYDRLGVIRGRYGNTHFAAAPGEHFRTCDGRFIILTVSADAVFERLCRVMERREWLDDPRFASHSERWKHVEELNAAVAAWIESQPVEQLCRTLDEAKLAYSFIYDVVDITEDPHYQAREAIHVVDDPTIGAVKMPGVFPKFSHTPAKPIGAAPALGQHNEEVFTAWLGLSPEKVRQIAAAGVI
jgi:crotonobetainyl-CoA:carnitine CoA-transferase CaiB-like acyl-CoA transferase